MPVRGREFESLPVALKLGVGLLAVHNNRRRGVVLEPRDDLPSAGLQRGFDSGLYGSTAGKIRVGVVIALPVDRPATTLHADVVGTDASHQDAGVRVERQRVFVVLQ